MSKHTNALQAVLGGFVSRVTGALVATDHINTLTILAQPVAQLAFIDICGKTKAISKFLHTSQCRFIVGR